MSDPGASANRVGVRTVLLTIVAIWAFLALSCGGCWLLFGRDKLLATFSIGPYRKLNVYAEPEFLYEPPGYIYFELKQWGQTRISRRRFMGIGPERKPKQSFKLITTDDEEIIALVLDNEVQMIHEFSSGFTWPGAYTNVTNAQWEMAELLLQKLRAANPDIRCTRQREYRKELDRRQSQ